jgi:chromate transporter
MALSWIYALYGKVGFVSALFFGLKGAVLAIVLQAVLRIGSSRAQEQYHARARGARVRADLLPRCAVPGHRAWRRG